MLSSLFAMALLSMSLQGSDTSCFTVTKTGDETPYISGESLNPKSGESQEDADSRAKRRAGVEAAIALIRAMEGDSECVITPPEEETEGVAGSPPDPTASLQLGVLLDSGKICVDTSHPGLASKFDAISARPNNKKPAAADDYTWEGYPAININPGSFPTCDSETGEMDEGEIAELAAKLMHELYHKVNPGEAESSSRDREGPAFTYEGGIIAEMLCCTGLSTAQASALCERLGVVNEALAKMDLPQIGTDKCGEGNGGSVQLAAAYTISNPETFPYFAPILAGSVSGKIKVDYSARTLKFDIGGAFSVNATLDLNNELAPELANFQPVSLDFDSSASAPKTLYLFGYDTVSLLGQIIRIDFDGGMTNNFLVTHLLYTSSFSNPTSAALSPYGTNRAFIVDHGTLHQFVLFSLISGESTLLLDSSTDSRMFSANYVRWIHLSSADPVTGSRYLRITIGAEESPIFSPAMQEISFYDYDLDGVIDLVE